MCGSLFFCVFVSLFISNFFSQLGTISGITNYREIVNESSVAIRHEAITRTICKILVDNKDIEDVVLPAFVVYAAVRNVKFISRTSRGKLNLMGPEAHSPL